MIRALTTAGGLTFRQMAVALLFMGIAAAACLMPMQADSFWHLRTGEDIWRTARVSLVESYSYTAAGRPSHNHEWLWELFSYLLFKVGGLPLLVLGTAATAVGACAIAYRLMTGDPLMRFVLMLVAVPLVASVWAVRPQVATLLLLSTLMWLLVHERYAFIPLLFVIWANVHGYVALGGWVLAAVTIAAAFGPRRRFWTLLAVTALSGLGTAATPLGFGLWRLVGGTAALVGETGVQEWQAAYPRSIPEVAFWLLVIAFLSLFARRWRRATAWPDRVLVVASLALLPPAVASVRNIAPFVLLTIPAASRLLGDWRWPVRHGASPDRPRLNLALAVGFGILLTTGVGVAWAKPHPRLGWQPISPAAVAAISSCRGQLFNRYNEGGYLIWFVRDKPVFVDSRYFPYPRDIVTFTGDGDDPAAEAALFSRFGITCAAVPPNTRAGQHLQASGWNPRYADAQWLVLDRPPVAPP